MIVYWYLFHSIYLCLKNTERSYFHRSAVVRVFSTIMIMSFLELFNLMSLLDSVRGPMTLAPFLILLIFNASLFFTESRYEKIVKHFNNNPRSILSHVAVTLYVLASFIFFWIEVE